VRQRTLVSGEPIDSHAHRPDVTLDELPIWFMRTFAIAFGLIWGSFLNVVIYRVPLEQSVVHPPSHCTSCKAPVKAWQNVPVLSWLLLRGKTACCGQPLSARYPLVEALGGLLAWGIFEMRVLTLSPTTSIAFAIAVFLSFLAVTLGLVAAAFIDAEHLHLPDSIVIGGTILGIATASLRQLSLVESLLGAAVGFVVVWLPLIVVYEKIRGQPGMGLGDAKLLALAGAWFGWPGALFVLCAGAVQGAIGTGALLLTRGKIADSEAVAREREKVLAEIAALPEEEREEALAEWNDDPLAKDGAGLGSRIPFGPFLVLAVIELVLFQSKIVDLMLLGGAW
jgi:leader peptidase (prepilin peptidase)/N-methyltransferase